MSTGLGGGAAFRSRCFLSSSRSAAARDSGVSSAVAACASWDAAGAGVSSAGADELGGGSDPCSVAMTVSACCAAACRLRQRRLYLCIRPDLASVSV